MKDSAEVYIVKLLLLNGNKRKWSQGKKRKRRNGVPIYWQMTLYRHSYIILER